MHARCPARLAKLLVQCLDHRRRPTDRHPCPGRSRAQQHAKIGPRAPRNAKAGRSYHWSIVLGLRRRTRGRSRRKGVDVTSRPTSAGASSILRRVESSTSRTEKSDRERRASPISRSRARACPASTDTVPCSWLLVRGIEGRVSRPKRGESKLGAVP